MRVTVDGPFAPGPFVQRDRAFRENQPGTGYGRLRVSRAAGARRDRFADPACDTQHVVAVAEMTDGRLLAAVARKSSSRSPAAWTGPDDGRRRAHHRSGQRCSRARRSRCASRSGIRWRPAIAPTTSVSSIPRNVIRAFTCRYDGEPVFAARMSSGIAANPYLRFFVTARSSGELMFDWIDDAGDARFTERVAIERRLMLAALALRRARVAAAGAAQERHDRAVGAAFGHRLRRRRRARDAGGRRGQPGHAVGRAGRAALGRRDGQAELRSCHGDARTSMRGVAARYPRRRRAVRRRR